MLDVAGLFVEAPSVEWIGDRPFAFACMHEEYAQALEQLAIEKEAEIRSLPPDPEWQNHADSHPTTARYSQYSAFLLSPSTLPLYFAIRETYSQLLRELDQEHSPRFVQCWYNVHRRGEALFRHKHIYPFIGTFSAFSQGSATRYGNTPEASDDDVLIPHVNGQLMVTTGLDHWHEVSHWRNAERPRVTFAFDIANADQWVSSQRFLPFDM